MDDRGGPTSQEPIRVLILEDNPTDAELLEHELREAGLPISAEIVETRETYTQALRKFRPHVILSDYDLLCFSGQEALQIRKELCPETPFILVTGTIGEERTIEILTLRQSSGGPTDYVLKRNLPALPTAVRRALQEAQERTERRKAEAERDSLLRELEKRVQERTRALHEEIAERKRAEETRQESEDILQSALEHSGIGIWMLTAEREMKVTPQLNALFGRPLEAPRMEVDDFASQVHPEDLPRIAEALRKALSEGDLYDQEYRVVWPDGSIHWLVSRGKVKREPAGEPRFIGVSFEITDLKRAEEGRKHQIDFENLISGVLARFAMCTASEIEAEIRASLKQIGLFLGIESASISLTSENTRTWGMAYSWTAPGVPSLEKEYRDVSVETLPWLIKALLRMEIIQIDSLDTLPPEAETERRHWERQGVKSHLLIPLRGRGRLVIGTAGFRSYSRPIHWREEDIPSLHLFSQAVANVLERKQAEEKLQERTRMLEEANRELESFSYSVSHDLRAPLRAVEGYSRMLLERAESLPDGERCKIQTIRENAQKMDRLIGDLLHFSRSWRGPLSRQKTDLNALVDEVWQEQVAANPGRKLELTKGDLPPAEADGGLVRQVLSNLLANAVKFSRSREPGRIEVGGNSAGKENVYYVRDNGVGFDMRYSGKLFGVFQRLHPENQFEGTGVGLAIVQRIVHRHGGRVWAEAEPGQGATFYFSLPAA